MASVTHAQLRKATPPTPLDALTELVAEDLQAVNALIVERMDSPVALIPQLAGYIVASGGKRLRPLLTLAAARLCGYQGDRHRKLAGAVEFIHTATLLHDDVVDESDQRRGLASANAVFGNKSSVLVGDFLFSRAFQLMVEDGSLEVLRILSTASAVIAEGEVLQLATTNDIETSEQAYLDVVKAKTAELFAAACEIGAVVAGRPDAEAAALRAYGFNLGIAFQIIDDVLDYSAVQARLGKTIGDDFREGKVTLPIVLTLLNASDEERRFWRRTIADLEQREGDLEHAMRLFRSHGIFAESKLRARFYGNAACEALAVFPPGELREAMLRIVEFTIERDF